VANGLDNADLGILKHSISLLIKTFIPMMHQAKYHPSYTCAPPSIFFQLKKILFAAKPDRENLLGSVRFVKCLLSWLGSIQSVFILRIHCSVRFGLVY